MSSMPLMLLLWGTRHYGRVLGHAGQFVVTRFGHVWFIPLIPLGSMWVTHDRGFEGLRGYAIKLSARSIAAAFLRVWGPIFALLAVAVGGLAGVLVAVPWALASAWSWSWRSVRGEREARRAAWQRAATGISCDPLVMEPATVAALYADARARFAAVSAGTTPGDVARLGAASPEQAIAAYVLLRTTAAMQSGAARREARELSERVLDAHPRVDADAVGGPYRRAA